MPDHHGPACPECGAPSHQTGADEYRCRSCGHTWRPGGVAGKNGFSITGGL